MQRSILTSLSLMFVTFFWSSIKSPSQERSQFPDEIETFPCSELLPSAQKKNLIEWYLPIKTENRQSIENVQLTHIGQFGLVRRARPGIPAHHHTGIDFKRPNDNYLDEPIYPAANGVVISLRDDGPYAQIIIQHGLGDSACLWTVYEHVAGIQTRLYDAVDPHVPIARFMTKKELDKYGWQFDHVHFEVLKVRPKKRRPDKRRPYLHYGTYWLECYNPNDLDEKYYSPLEFLQKIWEQNQYTQPGQY
jgi:hypothetical protein